MSKRQVRQAQRAKSAARNRRILLGGGILLLVAIVGVIAFALLQPQRVAAPGNSVAREISASDVFLKKDVGAFILDVRDADEFAAFHIAGSTLIPLGELEARLQEVPRDKEIIVVCRSGNRSASGRDVLLNAGYTNVSSMTGGLKDWQARGYPTISG